MHTDATLFFTNKLSTKERMMPKYTEGKCMFKHNKIKLLSHAIFDDKNRLKIDIVIIAFYVMFHK